MKQICLAVFLVFMALRPASAAETYYFAACLDHATSKESGNDCATISLEGQGLEGCKIARQLAIKQKLIVSRCTRNEEEAKTELAIFILKHPRPQR
jgi:hypothetical protein